MRCGPCCVRGARRPPRPDGLTVGEIDVTRGRASGARSCRRSPAWASFDSRLRSAVLAAPCSVTQVIHYDGDGDEPGWIVEDATQPDEVTRWVEGADGQVAVQTGRTGERVLQLVDLHGDVVGTVPIGDGAPVPSQRDLRFVSYDEFGTPRPLSGGATSNAPPRYGWLGAAQRSSDTPAGVVLMGVRLYHPGIGRFLQVDPVAGGSANAYDYCNADPVNCTDLGGTIAWGKVLGAVATIGEVASFIPGPVGAAAAGVSAVAYAASGNKGKALLMGVTAAATLVGAGYAVRGIAHSMKAAKAAQRSAMLNALKAPAKGGLTRGGREYQKHMKHLVPVTPSAKNLDRVAHGLARRILNHPKSRWVTVRVGNFKGGTRVIMPIPGKRGIGATWAKDGSFAYFGRY